MVRWDDFATQILDALRSLPPVDGLLSSSTGRSGVKGAPFLAALRYSRHYVMASPPLTPPLDGRCSFAAKAVDKKEAEMLGFEDVAGYSDLFTAEQVDAIASGDWTDVPQEDWGQGQEVDFSEPRPHSVTIGACPDGREGDEASYGLHCELCGCIGDAQSPEEAEAIARLHEAFVAVLVDRWAVS